MARRKKVPVKGSTRKTSRKKRRGGKASPPPDNPLLRHEELDVDRRIEGEDQVVESPSLVAAMAAATGKRVACDARQEIQGEHGQAALQASTGCAGEVRCASR